MGVYWITDFWGMDWCHFCCLVVLSHFLLYTPQVVVQPLVESWEAMKAQRASSQPKHSQRNGGRKAKNPKWHGHSKSLLSEGLKLSNSSPSARFEHHISNSVKHSLKSQKKQYAQAASSGTLSCPLPTAPKGKALGAHINGQAKGWSSSCDSDTEDSQGWRSYAQSVLQNGTQTIAKAQESVLSDHVEEEVEPFLTQFDHVNNRTLMVMRPGQVSRLHTINKFSGGSEI